MSRKPEPITTAERKLLAFLRESYETRKRKLREASSTRRAPR